MPIRNDRIIPYYQPIVDNTNGEYRKYESLVRLIDEEGKSRLPHFFFLEICQTGLNTIISLPKTVLEKIVLSILKILI